MAAAEPGDPLDAALRVARVLDERAISYAIGGALAYGLWGVPRATIDIDVNLFVSDEQLEPALAALGVLGIAADPSRALAAARREGLVVLSYGPFRLDLFVPSIDFAWEAERTRVRKSIEGSEAWFLSAEALAVFKLLFFRPKDLVDLERLIAVQGTALDAAYVRAQIVGMLGVEDPRVARWDELVAAHAG